MATDIHRTIDAVWRIESAKLIAALTRIVRDVGVAEDLAQDALIAALERWPEAGIPDNPGAWLMGTAKHRAIDFLRRNAMLDRKHGEIGRDVEEKQQEAVREIEESADDHVGDDLLRLILIACHPVLSAEVRAALTLRLLGGLTTDEIARAFLVPESTIAQRIVRAKRTLAEARAPFEVPRGRELAARIASVLEVIYLIFNEGYSSARPESRALGPAAHPSRTGRARTRGESRSTRTLHTSGGDRSMPRASTNSRGDRLEADRSALRRARGADAVARRGVESRGRRVDG